MLPKKDQKHEKSLRVPANQNEESILPKDSVQANQKDEQRLGVLLENLETDDEYRLPRSVPKSVQKEDGVLPKKEDSVPPKKQECLGGLGGGHGHERLGRC